MVPTADRIAGRRGISRLGRIEGLARMPFVEPPAVTRSPTRRLTRWVIGAAVLLAAAGAVWLFRSRAIALAIVQGEATTLAAPAAVLVEEVFVAAGEWCEKGRPLLRLGPREADPAREVLVAQLNLARLRLELVERGGETQDLLLTRRFDERDRLAAESEAALAALAAANAEAEFARQELTRHTELQTRGHYSSRELNEARRDAQVAEAEVDQARSELEGARLRWRRQQTLVPADSDGAELRDIELALLRESAREAEERVCEFDHRAGARTITAPFSGRVDRVFVQAGSSRADGEPLVSLFDPGTLYALAYVSPERVEDFPIAAPVRLYAEGTARPVAGVVRTVHGEWSPVPALLQRAYGEGRMAITLRIECEEPERRRLAPNMLLKVIAGGR